MGESWGPVPLARLEMLSRYETLPREDRALLDFAYMIGVGTAGSYSLRALAARWGFAGVRPARHVIEQVTNPDMGWCASIASSFDYAQKMRQQFGITDNDRLATSELIPRAGYVYVIGGPAAVKIGFSSNPIRRLQQLQTSCPEPLQLMASTPGTTDDEARWHSRLAEFRKSGEWFALPGHILSTVLRAFYRGDHHAPLV